MYVCTYILSMSNFLIFTCSREFALIRPTPRSIHCLYKPV